MIIGHQPVFDHIIETGGAELRPTDVDIGESVIDVEWSGGGRIHRLLLPIGTWDMDTAPEKDVAHGLTLAQRQAIIDIQVWIRDDAGTTHYPLNSMQSAATGNMNGAIGAVNNTNVNLKRFTTGGFDNISFDDAVINRGYVLITYHD